MKRPRTTHRKPSPHLVGNAVTRAATTNVVVAIATGTTMTESKGKDGKNGK